MCNCEYCLKCDICGHKADEHLAGDGPCLKCNCSGHMSKIADLWMSMTESERSEELSFQSFADKMVELMR